MTGRIVHELVLRSSGKRKWCCRLISKVKLYMYPDIVLSVERLAAALAIYHYMLCCCFY